MQRSPAPLMQVNCSGNGQRLARQPACATGASIKHRSSRCSRVPAAPCSSACSLAETRLGAPRRRFPRGCSGQRAELPSRRCGSRSRVGPKHFRCPRQRIVSTQKNQYNTDTNTIHFRKKILAKLEEGQSIRAVAQHFEIDKNTIVEWKKANRNKKNSTKKTI